jgi:hypothetical protein
MSMHLVRPSHQPTSTSAVPRIQYTPQQIREIGADPSLKVRLQPSPSLLPQLYHFSHSLSRSCFFTDSPLSYCCLPATAARAPQSHRLFEASGVSRNAVSLRRRPRGLRKRAPHPSKPNPITGSARATASGSLLGFESRTSTSTIMDAP